MASYKETLCPECGIIKRIRSDRTYCSVDCANVANGRARTVDNSYEKVVVFGDVHIPFHDRYVVELLLDFIEREKPDVVVANGDISDMYEVSSYSRDPTRKASLVDELVQLQAFLGDLRTAAGKAQIIYNCGNHEHRLHKYIIKNAPQLAGLPGLSFYEQANLEKFGIDYVGCTADKFVDTFFRYRNILIGHFAKVAPHAAYTGKALLDVYGMSLIQAHVHSMGFTHRTMADGIVGAWEGGCLSDLDPHYCLPRRWMHGWNVIHHEKNGSFFQVEPVYVINGNYRYGGKIYGDR